MNRTVEIFQHATEVVDGKPRSNCTPLGGKARKIYCMYVDDAIKAAKKVATDMGYKVRACNIMTNGNVRVVVHAKTERTPHVIKGRVYKRPPRSIPKKL